MRLRFTVLTEFIDPLNNRDFDVLIIGAGIAGIGGAWHLKRDCPDKSYAILEARDRIGGTWDLFRYPGVRSDSDMFTLGYGFHPWSDAKVIADGPAIRRYVKDIARKYDIDREIRFGSRVVRADWSSDEARWHLMVDKAGEEQRYTCRMLFLGAGYYNYEAGFTPKFDGIENFQGDILHPQKWPADYDYSDKRVIVIGSGATAITLVPSMADKAAHVTMLQRSPTYVASMPSHSPLAGFLNQVLPSKLTYSIMRWQRIILQQLLFKYVRAFPKQAKRNLIKKVKDGLPSEFDVETHFTPRYNPWDERLCLVPDDDYYIALKNGDASIVTGHIDHINKNGILLKNGEQLDADLIVTATGLNLQVFGGAEICVDGVPVQSQDTFSYRGIMNSDVPNLVSVFGYTNASWTLRSDLIAEYFCRIINFMEEKGYVSVTPVPSDSAMPTQPFTDFSSGYFKRAEAILPKTGPGPWNHPQDYAKDVRALRHGSLEDGELIFATGGQAEQAANKSMAAE